MRSPCQRLRGSPSTRSATMFRNTSEVPASIVLPRLRSCWWCHQPSSRLPSAPSSVPVPALARHVEQLPDADLERRREREAERAAFVQQRRHRDLPALAFLAEPVLDGNLDVVEEDLVELRLARDLTQRAHLDS